MIELLYGLENISLLLGYGREGRSRDEAVVLWKIESDGAPFIVTPFDQAPACRNPAQDRLAKFRRAGDCDIPEGAGGTAIG